jgi:hypothetical protein
MHAITYNIDAKTLDELITIYCAHTLPRGMAHCEAQEKGAAWAWAVADRLSIPTDVVKEALRAFAKRAPIAA